MSDLRILALVAVLALTGVAAVGASYDTAAHERQNASYQVEVVHDEWTDLEGTDLENVTVEDENGTALEEGSDYELDRDDGEIEFLSDGSTTEGEYASVEYSAILPIDLAETVAGPISSTMGLLGAVVLVLAVSFVVASLATFPRGRTGRRGWP
ncbi:MAG: hypothetical protein ACOCUO_03260 [archaeon]